MRALLSDLWVFMKNQKKYWLPPVVILFVMIGAIIILGQSSAITPFIYTLF